MTTTDDAAMQWRPIATAPEEKDVLLWITGRPPVVAGLFNGKWATFDAPKSDVAKRHQKIVAWMPLHPPPSEGV